MPKLGLPVTTAPWEAPADDDAQAHWLAGVRPRRLRKFVHDEPYVAWLNPGPRIEMWRDATGREWYVRA